MDFNSIMSSNLASLQQTLSLSVMNMVKNTETAQATALIEDMQPVQKVAPPSDHLIDIKI